MANWLHQLQSLLGQQGASPSGESSKGSGLLPGAIGGLAGLLVASKSSRKLLAKYGTSALLAGGGAVAGTVLWNKYQQKMRAQNTSARAPETAAAPAEVDPRSVRLITAPYLPRKATVILMTTSGRILKLSCGRPILTFRPGC